MPGHPQQRAIGIMGGTFDPVHYGHLRTAIEFRDRLDLTELRFIPCHRPPHRGAPGASSNDRVAMLRLALSGRSRMLVDEQELLRDGPSYTVDTLSTLRGQFGQQVPLLLLLGTDVFNRLDSWHEWQQLVELAHLVVAERPGPGNQPSSAVTGLLEQREAVSVTELQQRPAGLILRCRFTALDISASVIRTAHQAGRSLRFLLPDKVIDYIEKTGLYVDPQHKPGSNH